MRRGSFTSSTLENTACKAVGRRRSVDEGGATDGRFKPYWILLRMCTLRLYDKRSGFFFSPRYLLYTYAFLHTRSHCPMLPQYANPMRNGMAMPMWEAQ